ncbi:Transposable element P transposase, partial [Aphis craccivora]
MKIIHLYDPPHLLKGIKNNLLNKNAIRDHIIDLYEIDINIQDIKMLPRLTLEHIDRNKIKKMKVKNATQVLSERVSSIMSYSSTINVLKENAKGTADFCLLFDRTFDP